MMTVFNIGDYVRSTKIRDGMPVGSTGVVLKTNVALKEIYVKVDPNSRYPKGHSGWYFYPNQLELMELDILGDNDDDCV